MSYDLEILQDLFLPLLQEMKASPSISDGAAYEYFWAKFSEAIPGTRGELQRALEESRVPDAGPYMERALRLKGEYIAWLAQRYCAGETYASTAKLLENGDTAFTEEVNFQQQLLAAITQTGRAALKRELMLEEEKAAGEISDGEIAGAFRARQREELKRQLQLWDEEQAPIPGAGKKKRTRAIPLLFLRFAAAAAVGTVATVGIVKVYDGGGQRAERSVATSYSRADSGKADEQPMHADTTSKADTAHANVAAISHKRDSTKTTTSPYIVLKGDVVDTATGALVGDVTVTMTDESGRKQTLHSPDGKFRFRLPLHHDFTITGKKEGYHSARLSLSTRDAKDTDSGEVIEGVLHFSKDP